LNVIRELYNDSLQKM